MATYDKTNFYYLQLREDFFDDDAIEWLEEQPHGIEYSHFYLKLCLKSLRTSGIMVRKIGSILIPYDCDKLAEVTKTPRDTVIVAMQLLIKIGLIDQLESGELYLREVENMIGKKSIGAFKKQQQIERRNIVRNSGWTKGGKEVEIFPPNIKIEIEQEIDIDKDTTRVPAREADVNERANESKETEKANAVEEMFEEFWKEYPKKVDKAGSFKAFKNIKKLTTVFPAIMDALKKFKVSEGWVKSNGQFIPYPTTWIHQERWNAVGEIVNQPQTSQGYSSSSFNTDNFIATAIARTDAMIAERSKK